MSEVESQFPIHRVYAMLLVVGFLVASLFSSCAFSGVNDLF